MSSFGDELRAVLAKKTAHLHTLALIRDRDEREARRKVDQTEAAARAVVEEVLRPLLTEFLAVMQAAGAAAGGELQDGERGRGGEGETGRGGERETVTLRAAGMSPGSPHYEICLSCSPAENERIEVSLECLHAADDSHDNSDDEEQDWAALFSSPPPPLSPSPHAFFPHRSSKSFRVTGLDKDAVRRWSADLLKKCAAAVMEAGRKGT